WSILYCLEQFGPMTQTEIKDYLLVEAPTITRTIEKLEQNGWITRTPGKDKRARIITISEAGKTDLKPIIEQDGNMEATLLQHFSTEEKATLYHLLQKINDIMLLFLRWRSAVIKLLPCSRLALLWVLS